MFELRLWLEIFEKLSWFDVSALGKIRVPHVSPKYVTVLTSLENNVHSSREISCYVWMLTAFSLLYRFCIYTIKDKVYDWKVWKTKFSYNQLKLVSNCPSSLYHLGNLSYMKGSFFTCQVICIYIIVWSEWNILTVFLFYCFALFSILLLCFSHSARTFSFSSIFLTSKPVMTMNFIVTLSDTLKLAKHGTYALFRQSPIVYSFMKEKITKAINAQKRVGY